MGSSWPSKTDGSVKSGPSPSVPKKPCGTLRAAAPAVPGRAAIDARLAIARSRTAVALRTAPITRRRARGFGPESEAERELGVLAHHLRRPGRRERHRGVDVLDA